MDPTGIEKEAEEEMELMAGPSQGHKRENKRGVLKIKLGTGCTNSGENGHSSITTTLPGGESIEIPINDVLPEERLEHFEAGLDIIQELYDLYSVPPVDDEPTPHCSPGQPAQNRKCLCKCWFWMFLFVILVICLIEYFSGHLGFIISFV